MRIPRIHTEQALGEGQRVALEDQAARHVHQVLRLEPGAPLILFNGQGGEYPARIEQATRKGVTALTEAWNPREAESPLQIELGQGLSRGERMDYAVQKSVELGVLRISPLQTDRCGVRLPPERMAKRQGHWQRVAIAACEQCGRNRVPEVSPAIGLRDWVGRGEPGSLDLMLMPDGGQALKTMQPPAGPIRLLIGPEGGLSDDEVDVAEAAGFQRIQLGPRTLRTETAAVAALAAMQSLWGDG